MGNYFFMTLSNSHKSWIDCKLVCTSYTLKWLSWAPKWVFVRAKCEFNRTRQEVLLSWIQLKTMSYMRVPCNKYHRATMYACTCVWVFWLLEKWRMRSDIVWIEMHNIIRGSQSASGDKNKQTTTQLLWIDEKQNANRTYIEQKNTQRSRNILESTKGEKWLHNKFFVLQIERNV